MCIFSRPVISVNNTQIFARKTSNQSQFLVYQMNYESSDDNAMILPVPVKQPVKEKSLRFVDLKGYPEVFRDLAAGFPYYRQSFSIGCSVPADPTKSRELNVFKIGNYIASFVPSLADFSRLAPRFNLPEGTWSQIPQYANYGFAVFQLAAGSLKPHPMAFEFDSDSDSIYFPTVHIHDGEIHETEEFDHILYLQHAGFDSRVYAYQNADVMDLSTGLVRSKYQAKQFCDVDRSKGIVAPDLLVHRCLIRGEKPNQDTEIETSGNPATPKLNLRPLLSLTPLLVCTGIFIWFLRRRTQFLRAKNSADSNKQSKAK